MNWEELSDTRKQQLVKQLLVGVKKTPENTNRAKEALACHPFLVEKMLKEINSTEGYEKYDEDRAMGDETELFEDESGFDLGIQKDNEAELG